MTSCWNITFKKHNGYVPLDYYNKRDETSDRDDPLDKNSGKDTDVTEETGSAGDDTAPGQPLPGEAVATGAEEITENKDEKKTA